MLRAIFRPDPAEAGRQAPAFLGLALGLNLVFAGRFWRAAFAGPAIAALDTHQHVYWMRRFAEPGLFPGDPHTDYFQAIAPWGYHALYRALDALGVTPLVASKVLPGPLALLGAGCAFYVALRLFRVPAAACAAALLMSQAAWMQGDLATGTPRAFAYPLIMAFLAALAAGWGRLVALSAAATVLVYPQAALLQLATLGLGAWRREEGRLRLAAPPGAGWAATALVAGLGLYALQTAPFGPVLGAAEARAMPELGPDGFRAFFVRDPLEYWLFSFSSGLWPGLRPWRLPAGMLLAVLAPLLLRRPPVPADPAVGRWLLACGGAALGLFGAAHAGLFALYLPGRHGVVALTFAAALAAAAGLLALGRAASRLAERAPAWAAAARAGAALAAAGLVASAFATPRLPNLGVLRAAPSPALYAFLAATPRDAVVASLSAETEYIPFVAGRPVLVSVVANPYHVGFYAPVGRAMRELIAAQYAAEPGPAAAFLAAHGCRYLLLDRAAFEPDYLRRNPWLRQEAAARAAILDRLARGGRFALAAPPARAIAYASKAHVVLDARALGASAPAGDGRAIAP